MKLDIGKSVLSGVRVLKRKSYESFKVTFKHILDWPKHIEVDWTGFHTESVSAAYWEACMRSMWAEVSQVLCFSAAVAFSPAVGAVVMSISALEQRRVQMLALSSVPPPHTLSFSHSHFSVFQLMLKNFYSPPTGMHQLNIITLRARCLPWPYKPMLFCDYEGKVKNVNRVL